MSKTKVSIISIIAAIIAVMLIVCLNGCQNKPAVAATVNGSEILEEDITNQLMSLRTSMGLEDDNEWAQYMADAQSDAQAMRQEAIDSKVREIIIFQESEKEGVSVTDEEVDAEIQEIKDYYQYSEEDFTQQLESIGYTLEQYRDFIKNSILTDKLMEKVVDATVTDEDIVQSANDYSMVINGSKNITTVVVDNEDAAKTMLEQINSGESLENVAKDNINEQYSGWDILITLPNEVTDAIAELNEGDVSDVIKSSEGSSFYIVKVNQVATVPEGGFTSRTEIPEEFITTFEESQLYNVQMTGLEEYLQKAIDNAEVVVNPMPQGLPYDVDMSNVTATESDATVISNDENIEIVESTDDDVVSSESIEEPAE